MGRSAEFVPSLSKDETPMKSGNHKNVEAGFIKLRHIRAHVLTCFRVYAKYAQFARRKQPVLTWEGQDHVSEPTWLIGVFMCAF